MEQESRAYSEADQIILISEDGDKIYHSRKALIGKSKTFEGLILDCSDSNEVQVALSTNALTAILLYADTLECPNNDEAWIELLQAADYIDLKSRHNLLLDIAAKAYVLKKGAVVLTNVTFPDYVKKILNPKYLTSKEYEIVEEQKKEEERRKAEAARLAAMGPTGPIGPTGPTGMMGPVGPTGPMGSIGIQGLVGPRGFQGPQGPRGYAG